MLPCFQRLSFQFRSTAHFFGPRALTERTLDVRNLKVVCSS
jgi:hypothetical protein